jgi:hypothetical protein
MGSRGQYAAWYAAPRLLANFNAPTRAAQTDTYRW